MLRFASAIGLVTFAIAAYASSARPRGTALPAGSCSMDCDRKASDCIDGCEAKFQDPKARVECKLACVTSREKCESNCR